MPNPYVLLGIVLTFLAVGAGGFQFGRNYEAGQHARAEQLIEAVREKAQEGAASEIAKIRITNTTITRRAETITREVPVYRECVHDPRTERLLDAARAGRLPADAARDRVVP